jgi:hypothetical protein
MNRLFGMVLSLLTKILEATMAGIIQILYGAVFGVGHLNLTFVPSTVKLSV